MPSCPSCGNDLPGAFAFCPFCGAALAGPAGDLPQERRVVSVLFCDLVAFTASADATDVEDVQRRLGEYHDTVAACIAAFGGVVEKFVGDAVMAVFGAPVAHEDDAERAVRAGLAVLERVEALPGVHVRVGVNTGEALVNVHARPQVGESFVVGDVVNVAARLQAAAATDTVVVSASTYRATDRVFEYAELEPVPAKGKPEPLPLWHAVAAKSRFGTDLMRNLDTPMVGRSLELATVVNAFERARAGRLQLVTVVGDAGVGKSRLVGELFAHVEGLPELVTWRQGRCLPYGDGVRFWALAEIVKAHLGIYDGDTDAQVEEKLAALTAVGAEPWVVTTLASLLGLAEAESSSRDALTRALQRFVDLMVGDQTTVMVVEDLHWADPALLDFVESLADGADLPLLVLGTARPELFARRDGWMASTPDAATIRLTPLSASETAQLIDSRLGDVDLPHAVRQAVVERSGGNPLYAEEFVRMLRDRVERSGAAQAVGELAEEELPETVQALIASRLDTLEPQAREAVHDAAVMGKVLWSGAVAALGDRSRDEADAALRELVRKEMLRPMRRSSVPGDSEFAFTHVLVRDVAYGQLTRTERARKHATAVDWITRTAGERQVEFAEVLAYHADAAVQLAEVTGQTELAAPMRAVARHWLTVAARQTQETDHERAWRFIVRARELLPEDGSAADEVDVLQAWIPMAEQSEPNEKVWEVARHVLELRRAAGDPHALAVALGTVSTIAFRGGRHQEVLRLREEAVAVLRAEGASPDLSLALDSLALSVMYDGEVDRARELSQEALDLSSRWRPPTSEATASALCSALNIWALARAVSGEPEVLASYEEAIGIAQDWLPLRAIVLRNNRCCADALHVGVGALADLEAAIEMCVEQRMALSAEWLQSTSLTFRVAAGQLTRAASLAEAVGSRFSERGVMVANEAWSAWLEATTELGRPVDEQRLGTLLAATRATVTSDENQSDERVIGALGAATAMTALGDRAGAADLVRAVAHRPVWGFELAPRLARYARVARLCGALDVLPVLAATVPATSVTGVAGNAFVDGVLTEAADPVGAAASFDRAGQAYERLGYALDEVYALALAGLCRTGLIDAAERERGRAALAEAQRRFAEMGAAWPAERCGVELAVLDGEPASGLRL